MFGSLDAPTVFRVGDPTMGVPVLAVDYREVGVQAVEDLARVRAPVIPSDAVLAALAARITTLELTVAALQRPWWQRLAATLRRWWARCWEGGY